MMKYGPTLARIQVFLALAMTGSFTAADLNLTQSAISHATRQIGAVLPADHPPPLRTAGTAQDRSPGQHFSLRSAPTIPASWLWCATPTPNLNLWSWQFIP